MDKIKYALLLLAMSSMTAEGVLSADLQQNSRTTCPHDEFVGGIVKFGKYLKRAANGLCLYPIQPQEQAKTDYVLNRLGVTTATDGSNLEFHAAAEVFHAMDTLGDGRFQFHKNAQIRFEDHVVKTINGQKVKKYHSTCSGKTLIMRRSGCQATFAMDPTRNRFSGRNNTQHIAHEWGHCLGHMRQDGKSLYDLYKAEVPAGSCLPTWYSKKNYSDSSPRNEEFAEIFSLYLTEPDQLHSFEGCDKAFRFFATLFGEKIPAGGTKKITCESRAHYFSTDVPADPEASLKRGEDTSIERTATKRRSAEDKTSISTSTQ